MSIKRPADSATKSKILDAFDELLGSHEELEEQVKTLQAQLAQQAKDARKELARELEKAEKAAQQAVQNTPTAAPKSESGTGINMKQQNKMAVALELLSQLQTGASSTLAELSEKLSVKAHELQSVLKRAGAERDALKDLYDLDANEESLSGLLEDYDQTAKTSQADYEARLEKQQNEWTELQKSWQLEQQQRQKMMHERQTQSATSFEREDEEYEYKRELERRLAEDRYNAEQAEQSRQRAEQLEAQEKEWAERERQLSQRERDFWDVMTKADNMKAELDAAVKKAEAEGLGIGNKQTRIKADLLDKEIEGQRRIYEQRLANMQSKLQGLQTRIGNLSEQVSAASKQMQDLAVKAIEGAANTNSLSAFKELAMEQAKSQSKGKA